MVKKKVYVDLGHEGILKGMDPGAVSSGLKEASIVLEIGKYMKDMFANYENVEVKFSRLSDKKLSLNQRTNEANAWGADVLVSIHINAGGGKGFESFIYPGVGEATQAFQNAIHTKIMGTGVFTTDRGKKRANFHMLRESKMTAILTENGFIDNSTDAAALKNRVKLIALASGHVEGVASFLGLKKKAVSKPEQKPSGKVLYKVQVGAFSNKKNADNLAAELKKKGYSTYIVQE